MRPRSVLGFAACLLPGSAATYLTLTQPGLQGDPFAAVFGGIISGSLVGASVYAAETYRDSKADLEGEKQALRLQLALTQDLSGADVAGRDLTGLDLRGKTLRNANLAGCNLSKMDLSDVDFRGSNLRYADLSGCLLTYADMRLVDARHSSFRGATMIRADMRGGLFGGSDFRYVDAQGVDCRVLSFKAYKQLSNRHRIRFRSRVSGIEWPGSSAGYVTGLQGLQAGGSAWTGARLDGADLNDADFSYARLGDDFNEALDERSWRALANVFLFRKPNAVYATHNGWSGQHLPAGPASFNETSVEGTIFRGCSGPGITMSSYQVAAMGVPLPTDAISPRDPEAPQSSSPEATRSGTVNFSDPL